MRGLKSWTTFLVGVEVLLVVLIVVACYRIGEAKSAFTDTVANQRLCQKLAADIGTLRKMSEIAQETEPQLSFGNADLVRLADQCGMSESQLGSIQRLAPLAVEGTDYQRQDIALELRGVTMEQVLRLSLKLEESHSSTKVTSLQIAAARRSSSLTTSDGAEIWNTQLILTQLLYVARNAGR